MPLGGLSSSLPKHAVLTVVLQDNSDRQYRAFRNGLLPLILLASAFLGLKHIYTLVVRFARPASDTTNLYLTPFLITIRITVVLRPRPRTPTTGRTQPTKTSNSLEGSFFAYRLLVLVILVLVLQL